ncbi:putative esterase of the alpha-beta hydrolase superfamily, patatin-like phospholipase domain exported protein (plasmid) [Cupriavidus taiwanensis]|uniref:Putative esterase of the alpha-beta hydrolase superfamily, patatin-like phospholipase domain exported protein n=1 Tax=Cupriavidus taiwanensis TaxID=164546 RepID=A0A375IQI5_9BURK|nr:patatin-like phospholipase family protein [Cupriavidus taiwanensis]SPK76408.1 putative esterase of the alpha-beta hydrolase superfamily, patatin-like phospholipase domain exported protein [Cupriavidus taiwanensis]
MKAAPHQRLRHAGAKRLLAAIALAAGAATAAERPAPDHDAGAAASPAVPGHAQPGPAGRPRICLVLSGGGARGAAHIGVLKVLEAMHIPVDCIAGTSMGSLVGGAYASGMGPAEMERLVAGLSTDKLFKERPPRQDLTIRRKQDDYTNLLTPEIGVQASGLLLPKGAVSGVQLETVLRQLARTPGYRDFDRLPIPYRAVATDLVAGTPVVFSQGELANVMRASMSVPGAVAPAEYEGRLLVDGGLTDNLPVGVARSMGADIVIAVNLGTSLMKREELTSVIGVTGQMLNILTEQNVRASLASLRPTDVLIEPALGDFSATDFDHLTATIPIGEAAARKVADRLAPLALPPAQYAELRAAQQAVQPPDTRPVDEIWLAPLHRVNPDYATAVMQTRPGEPIDQAALDQDMRRLFGTGDFEHVNYGILEEPGRRVLTVNAVEKSWGPDYLRFGLGLSSDFRGDAYFNLVGSYRRTWLNALGAEWRTDVQVGQTSALASEFYQPLDTRQFFFIAPRIELERRPVNVFRGSTRIATYDVRRFDLALDVGSQFTKYGELRVGVQSGTEHATLSTGPASLAPGPGSIRRGAVTGRLFFDQLDSVDFPRFGYAGGLRIYASQPGLGADQTYIKAQADGIYAHSFGDHTLSFAFKVGGNPGGKPLPNYDLFQWGGFLQQSGYATGQLMGGNLQFARLVYYNKLARQTLLQGVYAGFSLEAGRVGDPLVPGSPTGLLKSGSLFLALDSPLGPLYLAYGRAAAGVYSFYLFLGKPF